MDGASAVFDVWKRSATSNKLATLPFTVMESKWLLSIVVIVCCLPFQVRAEPKCHMIELEHCFDNLHTLKEANHDPSELLTSTDGLNRICRLVCKMEISLSMVVICNLSPLFSRVVKHDFAGCIVAYLQKCGTPLHKELSKVLSEAILEHMEQICSPNSPFRDGTYFYLA